MTSPQSERKLHAYCVGQAKSGTATLFGMFEQNFRAAHEPERSELLGVVLERMAGRMTDDAVDAWLRERDARLGLDLEVSWCVWFVLDRLPRVFPEARFIALVREPAAWLNSIVGHMLTRDIPADARAFMETWFKTADRPHGPGEARLRDAGLFSLEAYLRTWREHLERCRELAPADRLLVVRTDALPDSADRIARFLGVRASEIDVARGRLNRGGWEGRLEDLIEPAVIDQAVRRWAGGEGSSSA